MPANTEDQAMEERLRGIREAIGICEATGARGILRSGRLRALEAMGARGYGHPL